MCKNDWLEPIGAERISICEPSAKKIGLQIFQNQPGRTISVERFQPLTTRQAHLFVQASVEAVPEEDVPDPCPDLRQKEDVMHMLDIGTRFLCDAGLWKPEVVDWDHGKQKQYNGTAHF